MKRHNVNLTDIASYSNLVLAFYRAAKGKKKLVYVKRFLDNFDININQLSSDIFNKKLPYGNYREFHIRDPKKRVIHAACFEDRIFHHALINKIGNNLEKGMIANSYACRKNKGVHKAITVVQKNLRRYKYYGKIDIDGYFAAINHDKLMTVLQARFKGKGLLEQLERIIKSFEVSSGVGIPIGALTSQYFANYFLNDLDRLLGRLPYMKSQVRYMDDIVWWCNSTHEVKQVLEQASTWLNQQGLKVKPNVQIQASNKGISYCGFRVTQGLVRLSRRKKRRYYQRRLYWEKAYLDNEITLNQLQQAYSGVQAITAHTDSLSWRQENLRKYPSLVL